MNTIIVYLLYIFGSNNSASYFVLICPSALQECFHFLLLFVSKLKKSLLKYIEHYYKVHFNHMVQFNKDFSQN